jgi:hypothetical protein
VIHSQLQELWNIVPDTGREETPRSLVSGQVLRCELICGLMAILPFSVLEHIVLPARAGREVLGLPVVCTLKFQMMGDVEELSRAPQKHEEAQLWVHL